MKTILKMLFGLAIGIVTGFAIAAFIIVIFTDKTFTQFIDGLLSLEGLETVLVAGVGALAFVFSILILIPIHEAGHLVCGLLSGYKFVSFRIFNFTFIKIDNKIKVKKFSVAGTGGQCLLTPPEVAIEKIPTVWYNAGGVLANILVLLLVLPLFFLDLNPFVVMGLVIFCLTDAIIILLNGIPMKLGGTCNDGYNILHLNKNLLNKQSLVLQLRTNALIQAGIRPKDMPDEWFENKRDINYKNPLEVAFPINYASRLVDELKFEEAYQEFSDLYSHKEDIIRLYVNEIECELIFCALATGKTELGRRLLTPEQKKYIEAYKKFMSSKQRLLCAIALYIEDDRNKALQIYENLQISKEKYLLQGEVKSDLAIMNYILN